MKFYTSNYARNGSHPKAVAISIRPPTWYTGRRVSYLAPTWDIVMGVKNGSITQLQYIDKYSNLLESLSPDDVANWLGDGAVMLCFEKPTEFCHRHLVARWLSEAGYPTEELHPYTLKQQHLETLLDF